jgi:hypothetical protein
VRSQELAIRWRRFEFAGGGGEGVAGRAGRGFHIFRQEGVGGGVPELGFGAAHAAEAPLAVDEGIDEETLIGIGGAVVLVVFGGELGETFGGFVEHDLMRGVDAVFPGVETGCGCGLAGSFG